MKNVGSKYTNQNKSTENEISMKPDSNNTWYNC
jgi:hypothetical protein